MRVINILLVHLKTWSILVQAVIVIVCDFSQCVLNGVHSPISQRRVMQMTLAYWMLVCVSFVPSTSGIVSVNADPITDHNQSAKVIVPYFQFQFDVEDPGDELVLLSKLPLGFLFD